MLIHQRIKQTGVLLVAAATATLAQPSPTQPKMTQNPFMSSYTTPHQTAPFDKIKNADYLPALKDGLVQGRKEVDVIVANTASPNV